MSSPPPANNTCLTCYNNNNVSGQNIVTSLIVDLVIGALCYAGFVLFRNKFPVYSARLSSAGVSRRPPQMRYGSHWQLWSWLVPTWGVSDYEFLATSGFDALVSTRVVALGTAVFVPLTILGVGVILPINYIGSGAGTGSDNNLTYVFEKMTISNVDFGSSVLWCEIFNGGSNLFTLLFNFH